MKLEKKLSDFPDYMKIHNTVEALRTEKSEVSGRLEKIALELSQPRQQQIDSRQAWELALEGKDCSPYSVDNRSELRDEQLQLEGRLRFLDDALTVGEMELSTCRGKCSASICQEIRGEWTAEIKAN